MRADVAEDPRRIFHADDALASAGHPAGQRSAYTRVISSFVIGAG
jgi:hypothetical protein